MPPVARTPQRPRKLWTSSRDRLCLSSGGGIIAFIFGLVFSTAGLICVYVFGWLLLSILGVVSTGASTIANESIFNQLFGLGGMLFLSLGHFVTGTLLLFTLRATFDRARDLVIVRSGWLGLWRRTDRLSLFQRVIVATPRGGYLTRDLYDIALEGEPRRVVVVARVSLSRNLAYEVAAEIAEFTGLAAPYEGLTL